MASWQQRVSHISAWYHIDLIILKIRRPVCLFVNLSFFLSICLSIHLTSHVYIMRIHPLIIHPIHPIRPSIHPSIHPYQHIYLYRYVRIDPGFYWSFGVRLQEVLPRKISEPIVDTSFGHVWSAGAMLVLRNVSCIIYYVNL